MTEYKRKYDCCQLCGIDADVEPLDQETGLCASNARMSWRGELWG